MSIAQQAGSPDGLTAQAPRPRARKRVLVAWLIAVAVAGFVMWLVYAAAAAFGGVPDRCFIGWDGGGQIAPGSVLAAAVIGVSLWLVASVVAGRLRSRLASLFVGFVALYVVGLVVLWEVSELLL